MTAILATLGQMCMRLIATGIAERLLLSLARELAARTASAVDDQIVDAVEAAVKGTQSSMHN